MLRGAALTVLLARGGIDGASASGCPGSVGPDVDAYVWDRVNPGASWTPRAGIQVLDVDGAFYMIGGRTPRNSTIPGDSDIWGEVWKSGDRGLHWDRILATDDDAHWPARAYFKAVRKGRYMYILGGQNYKLVPNECAEPGNASLPCADTLDPGGPGCLMGGVCQCGAPPAVCGSVIESPFMSIVVDEVCAETCGLCPSRRGAPERSLQGPAGGCVPMVSASDFFNDVWRSADGVGWTRMTQSAGWSPRAGLSAVLHEGALFVMGGSLNDDTAIVGGPPTRLYFNDVWKSDDGQQWTLVTPDAPWSPRAGGRLVSKDGYMFMIGGEVGFLCEPLPDCAPPYFNDVWRSRDGLEWELLVAAAPWAARPGHECVVALDTIVCFGGFGPVSNPTDVFYSRDGASWSRAAGPAWGAADPRDIKYDFDALAVCDGEAASIYTFGGDRETFDFSDPDNFLRVDNDVWAFRLPGGSAPAPTPPPGSQYTCGDVKREFAAQKCCGQPGRGFSLGRLSTACGSVLDLYRQQHCCGNPGKSFVLPAA